MDKSSSSDTQLSKENINMDKSSSSDTLFSKEKIKYPISKYPELDRLPIESLIRIHEGLCRSVPLKKSKAAYLRDKSSGFQTNTTEESFLLGEGKTEVEEEDEGEGFCGYGLTVEEETVLAEREGWDSEEDCDEDGDCDEEYEEDYDDDDNDVTENNWNPILMGKQFLLKFIEVEKIEADLNKLSVEKAFWAVSINGGRLADSILFFETIIFTDSNLLKSANKHQDTQVWKIYSDKNSDKDDEEQSSISVFTSFFQIFLEHTLRNT